jgi:hypothetical protein
MSRRETFSSAKFALEECQRFLDGSFNYRLPRKTLKEVTHYHWLLRRLRKGTKHKPDGIAVFVGFRPSDACYRDSPDEV